MIESNRHAIPTIVLIVALIAIAACVEPISVNDDPPIDYRLEYSLSADRSVPQPLDGAVLDSPFYVFVEPSNASKVAFFIDDGYYRSEVEYPFDLEGAVSRSEAIATDPTDLGSGEHVIEAVVTRPDGSNTTISASVTVPHRDAALLAWAPPVLTDPVTIAVDPNAARTSITLDPSLDYRIILPDEPVTRGLALIGGRNVVLIGGAIAIPYQGTDPTIQQRRGLYIVDATGTVHVEGLRIHGEDLSEGIQINAPGAIVQLENVLVDGVYARDRVGFTDNHPDLIQTWGSVGELRVDRFSGSTDYQGLFFKADFNGPHGPVHLRNVDIIGDPTARYLLWMSDQGGSYPQVSFENVYVDPAAGRGFGKAVWPDVDDAQHPAVIGSDADGAYATWPTLPVEGRVREGRPPGGSFARAGIGYVSPGYE